MIKQGVVESDPEILGGTVVFVGTRVPAQTLFDYFEANQNLDEFLDDFPAVKREQAILFMQYCHPKNYQHQ